MAEPKNDEFLDDIEDARPKNSPTRCKRLTMKHWSLIAARRTGRAEGQVHARAGGCRKCAQTV